MTTTIKLSSMITSTNKPSTPESSSKSNSNFISTTTLNQENGSGSNYHQVMEESNPSSDDQIEIIRNNQIEGKHDDILFSISFFLFGLLNNVLYVIIISAALDLVPSDVPPGIILLADITPSLIVKLGWPYLVRGEIRYEKRIISCSVISFVGMMVIVIFPSVTMRLIGISLASFSSGLGEMTFLQLSTTFINKTGVSWFASGTGAAGVVGAGWWWTLRNMGIKIGLGLSSILPICLSLVYFFLLPFSLKECSNEGSEVTTNGYTALNNDEDEVAVSNHNLKKTPLTLREKLRLARPLFLPFMLPLFTVYFAEYTINTGLAPTLLYPVPTPDHHVVFSHLIKSLKDYYPFYQLTYQIFVFFSRSSIAILRFPPMPRSLISLPSLIQVFIFSILLLESSHQILFNLFTSDFIYAIIFGLISLEGICGGLAYVSVFYWLSLEDQHQEFKIGCVGFSDTIGILYASLFSSWLEPRLCGIQVSQGRELCREVKKL
ncbi:batten's disease protein Cln3 [Melampsora americana]|nr:batten's disease protein Cln3 [Melampsora americana]